MYQTPPLYIMIHIAGGAIAYFFTFIIPLFLLYQFGQWFFDIRFFFFSMEIKRGNSLYYTLYKIAQFCVGYLLSFLAVRFRTTTVHTDPVTVV